MKTYKIATVVKVKNGHAWFERMEAGVKKFAQDTGHNAFMAGPPKADENLQLKVVEDVITQGINALCVVPFFPQALEMALTKARRQGIVVISHEATNQRNSDYDLEAFDNAVYGAHLMDHLARYMQAEGQYTIMVGSLMSQSHSEWARAAIDRQKAQYPKMILATKKIEDHDDPALAYQQIAALLGTNSHLKGVLAIGMTASIGAGRAIEERQLGDQVIVVGTGLVGACKPYLSNGAVKLISCWDPADAGYVLNKLAVMVLEGQKITEGMDLGVPGYAHIKLAGKVLYGSAMLDMTKDNMAQYHF